MQRKAAEWENLQQKDDYFKKVEHIKNEANLDIIDSLVDLRDYLVSEIKKYRSNYSDNDIINILLCYTQGFLTVFSGDPGTGKTSICEILGSVLGSKSIKNMLGEYKDGYNPNRYLLVPVQKGWTTKRDFIGYYNPLTKTFDRSNRRVFDALNIMHQEVLNKGANLPYTILLDEANLSPMEYYWSEYMSLCEGVTEDSIINLGEDYCLKVPNYLRFLATINNDHTTENLSPRLIDRAWIIKLPKIKISRLKHVNIDMANYPLVKWDRLVDTFGITKQESLDFPKDIEGIYNEFLEKAKISISPRVDKAIKNYWFRAKDVFKEEPGNDNKLIIALDYALAQKILPKIEGNGESYAQLLDNLISFSKMNQLLKCVETLSDIKAKGELNMKYFNYFA